jgi:hypothetical protein
MAMQECEREFRSAQTGIEVRFNGNLGPPTSDNRLAIKKLHQSPVVPVFASCRKTPVGGERKL